jgi:HEAT repeat protein
MAVEFPTALNSLIEQAPQDSRVAFKRDVELILHSGITTPELLCQAPSDPNLPLEVRAAACWALGRLGGQKADHALLDALNSAERQLSFEAAKSLVALSSKSSVPGIRETLLVGANPHNRAAAAYTLGMLGDNGAVQSLIDLLNSEDDADVRSHAAEALGYLGDEVAVDSLLKALNDTAPEMRFWSAFALGQIRDPRAVPQLQRLASTDKASLPGLGSISEEALNALRRIQET